MEEGDLAAGKSTAAERNAWIPFEEEAGQSMTPPRARTWGRFGLPPVVRVRGRGSEWVSMAGMACYKPGQRSRLIYAIRECRGRKDKPKGFGRRDFRDLIVRALIRSEAIIHIAMIDFISRRLTSESTPNWRDT